MTDSEFAQWLVIHKQAFPGVGPWLQKNHTTVGHWQAALEDVDFDAAEQATAEMLRGDIDSPRGYSDHVRAVRQRAKEIRYASCEERRPSRIDGQAVFACSLCLDSGFVLVLDPEQGGQALLDWARGDRSTPHPSAKTAVVACSCEIGGEEQQRLRSRREPQHHLPPREIDRYDERRHFRCDFQWANTDSVVMKEGPVITGLLEWIGDRFNFWKE
jgi:hypothetical protein